MEYNREYLLNIFAPKVIETEVIDNGKEVKLYVRELSAEEVFEIQTLRKRPDVSDEEKQKEFAVHLLSTALVGPTGEKLFTQEQAKSLLKTKIGAFNSLTSGSGGFGPC
jgi:hypothetical protein